MSPRAAWRLENLGFKAVYDYVDGKKDWFDAGLPLEGEIEQKIFLGHRTQREVPTARMAERVGEVAQRARAVGWNQAAVVNDAGILLGWLGPEALAAKTESTSEDAMLEGPITFRPNNPLDTTSQWMQQHEVDSVLVTGPDGTLIGIARREDVEGRSS